MRIFEIPELDAIDCLQRDRLPGRIVCCLRARMDCGACRWIGSGIGISSRLVADRLLLLRDCVLAVAEFYLKRKRSTGGLACEEAVHIERWAAAQNIFGSREDVVEVDCRNDA